MTLYPNQIDDDTSLTPVNDNISEIGERAIMDLRDAVFAIEQALGISIAGSTSSLATRLGVAINPDGTIRSSALTSLGLVTLPITQDQIAVNAGIPESKLKLDHRTQDLFNYVRDLSSDINTALGWINVSGVKLEPHLLGVIYRHSLDQVDVVSDPSRLLKNKFGLLRNSTSAFDTINDMNSELLAHQLADGSPFGVISNVTTNNGSVYPSNYGHTAGGIFLNSTRFQVIPQSIQDLQNFAQFIDSASIFLYGSRIQNLYTNGISRVSRSSSLVTDGYGQPIIPSTPAIAYLLKDGSYSNPLDDIDIGDDIIELKPSSADMNSNAFDEKFALVKIGDIVRINYGSAEVTFIIKEKKYLQGGSNKKYVVRIAGRNLFHTSNASVRIERPLFNPNKSGVLALAPANNAFSEIPSLIIGQPRGAQALGIGFNPDQLDASHYLLYLALYPNGSPQDGYFILPAIDVTGNRGATPGQYTLDSVIESANQAFRVVGYNYRFIAYSYQGEFGIMLADPYGNASFSILSAVVAPNGSYDVNATNLQFPNNVVGIVPSGSLVAPDPLGLGPFGANIASPPFMTSYGSAQASQIPTKIFVPLKRNNYYVNGIERDKMALEVGQALDGYGDGYWVATVQAKNVFPGSPPTGRVETTYRIPLDLSTSTLKPGKTLVVQSLGQGSFLDFGRFIIKSVTFSCAPNIYTDITVYDAVHATGTSPQTTLALGSTVAVYFCPDSVSFNKESATDFSSVTPFKRHFEVYVNQDGKTFTHERARINISSGSLSVNGDTLYTYSELAKLNIVKVSPKLRGYLFNSVTKITLNILSFDTTLGDFNGYLSSYDGTNFTKKGPTTFGRKGQVVRFYDETNVDYIDIVFDVNTTVSSFTNQVIDFQLFPTLSLDDEVMLIGTCQVNDATNFVNYLRDERQFGNTSEKDLSTSALNFIALPEKLFHSNGVVRGFDLSDASPNPNTGQIYLKGGVVLANGKIKQLNNETVVIPMIKESFNNVLYNVNWLLCVNDGGEYQPIPMLDFDPSLATPSSSSRIFKAFNPINGQYYFLDASTFSNVINNRKDLVPIYIVAATVNEIAKTISVQLTDVRRYINDADTNFPLRLTSGAAQGNFKNPEAILNWIKYNNAFNGKADVKGATIGSGVINLSLALDFANSVTIEGENNAVLTFNSPITIGSNITFKDLTINFNGGITVKSASQNVIFDGCIVTYTAPVSSPPPGNIIFDFSNGSNIQFKGSSVTANYSSLISGGAVFNLNNTSKFVFENSAAIVNFVVTTVPTATPTTPGDMFSITNSPNVLITGSQFSGNFNRFIFNSASSSLRVTNSSAQSTYDPSIAPAFSYDTTDLVNSGQGFIYSNVSTSLSDILLDNVTFSYNPTVVSSERFSFINFELSSATAILSGLVITNCKFNHLKTDATHDDFKPAISIINTTSATTTLSDQPIVLNARISNNKCNRNQSIVLTSKTISSQMRMPGLSTIDVKIENNICGTIGYWISGGTKIVNLSPNVNASSDKTTGLLIANNTCHNITNVDHRGQYFLVSRLIGSGGGTTTNMCGYPSGNVIIQGNDTNWIHVGISMEEDASLKVIENALNAYDVNYLATYGDTQSNSTSSGNIGSYGYAIFVNSNKHSIPNAQAPGEGNDSSCIISGNTVSTGYWILPSANNFTYNYPVGYIDCQSSNAITHNILKGAAPPAGGGTLGHLILVGGVHNTVTHNKIFRGTGTVTSYVGFFNYETPTWDGTGASGMIVDNTFDSPYINDVTLDENVIKFNVSPVIKSLRWIAERNKNQTGYKSIPVTNSQLALNIGLSGDQSTIRFFNTNGALTYVTNATNPGGVNQFSSLVLRVHDENSAIKFYGWQEDLDKHLPNGVRILQLKMGIRGFGAQLETPFNVVGGITSGATLYLNKYASSATYTNLDYFASASSNDTNVLTTLSSAVNGSAINSTSSTLYMTIDTPPSNDDSFIVGQGFPFSAGLSIFYRIFSVSVDLFFSPLYVKYRW
jgi:hypothetical protein